jgi:hypothetical protein
MVEAETSAVPFDIHQHTFHVITPAQTDATGIPNSCNVSGCHPATGSKTQTDFDALWPEL